MAQSDTERNPQRRSATRETLLERAAQLSPVLQRRAEEGEKLRRCPDVTIADFIASGLLRICQPARYGGNELGYDVLCEASQTLARGCGSQAWVHMVFADNALKLSAYSLEAQDEVWTKNPNAKLANAVAPVGRGQPVDGGVLWSGRHGFSSGVDHADWVMASGYIERGDTRQGCSVLIPKSDIVLVDDWHVLGLAGTGSKTFVVEGAFVPEHRILDKRAADEGKAPGTLLYTSPVSKLPRGGVSAVSFTSVVVGIAEGFLEEYFKYTGPRLSRGTVVAEQMGTQISAGLSAAEVEAASRMYLGAIRKTMQTLERGETVSRHDQLRGKRNAAYAAQLALRAVQRLFNAAGGRALYAGNELQRKFRDVHAAAAHHSLAWDSAAAAYGRYVLGQPGVDADRG
jgi:3-hydroxy-9,10-secoandrosta-1,3,5(10)-triene-9,17-dione monooxygenase